MPDDRRGRGGEDGFGHLEVPGLRLRRRHERLPVRWQDSQGLPPERDLQERVMLMCSYNM